MTSRHRKPRYRRWGLLILLLIAIGTYWFWPDAETPPANANAQDTLQPQEHALIPPAEKINPTHRTQTLSQDTTATATQTPAVAPTVLAAEDEHPQQSYHSVSEKPQTSLPHAASLSTVKPTAAPILKPVQLHDEQPLDSAVTQTDLFAQATRLMNKGQWVEARSLLNARLTGPDTNLSPNEAHRLREKLAQMNATLIFSPRVTDDDPFTEFYTIASGDLLAKIAPRYNITYQLIEHVNGISARRIRVGQRIKLIRGPFHAVVDKSDYRMDLFLTDLDGQMVYIRSLPVGLGEDDSTPLGSWIVRQGGKVANPGWTNPRTGKVYAPDDPLNPIGEYWIGLEGTDDQTRNLAGYGIHGTIELDSIGKQVSMGCVRLLPDDIALVYKLLVNGRSTVVIQP